MNPSHSPHFLKKEATSSRSGMLFRIKNTARKATPTTCIASVPSASQKLIVSTVIAFFAGKRAACFVCKLLQGALACEAASVRKFPRRILLYLLIDACLKLSFSIRRRTLHVRQELYGTSEEALRVLAMRTPESSVENRAF